MNAELERKVNQYRNHYEKYKGRNEKTALVERETAMNYYVMAAKVAYLEEKVKRWNWMYHIQLLPLKKRRCQTAFIAPV